MSGQAGLCINVCVWGGVCVWDYVCEVIDRGPGVLTSERITAADI